MPSSKSPVPPIRRVAKWTKVDQDGFIEAYFGYADGWKFLLNASTPVPDGPKDQAPLRPTVTAVQGNRVLKIEGDEAEAAYSKAIQPKPFFSVEAI